MSKPLEIQPGSHLPIILSRGDTIRAHSGLVVFARRQKRTGDEEWSQLYRDVATVVEVGGVHFIANQGLTVAGVEISRPLTSKDIANV